MIKVRIKAHDIHNAEIARRARRALRRPCRAAVAEGLEILAEEVRLRAPVDSGALRDGVRADLRPGSAFFGSVAIESHYAMFIEFGTDRMPARPFIRPAAAAAGARVAAAAAAAIRRAAP